MQNPTELIKSIALQQVGRKTKYMQEKELELKKQSDQLKSELLPLEQSLIRQKIAIQRYQQEINQANVDMENVERELVSLNQLKHTTTTDPDNNDHSLILKTINSLIGLYLTKMKKSQLIIQNLKGLLAVSLTEHDRIENQIKVLQLHLNQINKQNPHMKVGEEKKHLHIPPESHMAHELDMLEMDDPLLFHVSPKKKQHDPVGHTGCRPTCNIF